MILETVCVGVLRVNCYIIASDKAQEAIIIDPGAEENKIRKALDKHKLRPAFIINTHGHFDHIGCDDEFGVPVYAHPDDAIPLKSPLRLLEDNKNISLDEIELQVIHTPGHTPGGICLLMKAPCDNILFSGDTLFRGSIGRTDFAQGDEDTLIRSIKERLLALADDTVIYPGHGPASTIGYERKHNPFLI